jgi:adenylate cyclase
MLVEFASAVDAVACAVAIQEKMAERAAAGTGPNIQFPVGINVGDIIIDGKDIFGDGVNVAARVENECEPGGVCLSGNAFEQVRGKTGFAFDDLGERSLKNIDRPVRLYAVRSATFSTEAAAKSPAEADKPLPLPDKPSIAVLPFQNLSGDPEQEYFADGMVEEIITALSRFKSLFVIARNSSFSYKGKSPDIRQVGRDLGVRYALEGSVRKASGKVRITGQLIDAVTGAHLWADRFERDLTDVFALQDEVTLAVVSAIQPKLLQTEIEMATRRQPENLTAYDYYLRAMQRSYLSTREGVAETLRLAHRALELDPRFGPVAALAGMFHMQNVLWGYAADPQSDRKEAVRLSRLALSIDDGDAETVARVAHTSAFMVGDSEAEIEMIDRAVALNPNSFRVWNCRGWVHRIAGLPEEAVRSFERAIRMSPVDPMLHASLAGMGYAFIELHRFDEAIVAGRKALRQDPSYSVAYRCLASAFAHLGRDAEAREAAASLLEVDPAFTISAWIARGGQKNAKLTIEGLRKAGLPE